MKMAKVAAFTDCLSGSLLFKRFRMKRDYMGDTPYFAKERICSSIALYFNSSFFNTLSLCNKAKQ
jgi:hypothetical protein